MTTFLRFPDEARAIACMGDWYGSNAWQAPDGCAIDVLGPIDDQGFHLNVLGAIPAKAMVFAVEPGTPRRVFA
jgi:hypothetical protein